MTSLGPAVSKCMCTWGLDGWDDCSFERLPALRDPIEAEGFIPSCTLCDAGARLSEDARAAKLCAKGALETMFFSRELFCFWIIIESGRISAENPTLVGFNKDTFRSLLNWWLEPLVVSENLEIIQTTLRNFKLHLETWASSCCEDAAVLAWLH